MDDSAENLPILPLGDISLPGEMPPEVRAVVPELEVIWDIEMEKAFKKLSPLQTRVVAEWIRGGCHKMAVAYKTVVPDASDETARSVGSAIMRNKAVQAVLGTMKEYALEDFFSARNTLVEALEAKRGVYGRNVLGLTERIGEEPDHTARIRAAEVIAKLHGLNAPEKHKIEGEFRSVVIEVQMPPLKPLDKDE